jgi:hypothetical protein
LTAAPRVKFAVRYPAGEGRWHYETVMIRSWEGSVHTPMDCPPAIGDLIILYDTDRPRRQLPPLKGGPVFRVVDRLWSHAMYGSVTWPYGKTEPSEGPLLDIIVEPSEGVYADLRRVHL